MPLNPADFQELTPEGLAIMARRQGLTVGGAAPSPFAPRLQLQAENVQPGNINEAAPQGWQDVQQRMPVGLTPNLSQSSYTGNPAGAGGGMLPRDAMTGGGGGSGGMDPLSALAEQFQTIQRLSGSSPLAPQVNHMIESGSPTAGLMNLNSGRMVGDQTPSRAVIDPAAALEMQRFGIQDRGHGDDQRLLMERLGTMGQQELAGGDLNLRRIGLLGLNGQGPGGSLDRENRLAQSTIDTNALDRILDTQHGYAWTQWMANPENGRTPAERQASWNAAGMRNPNFARRGVEGTGTSQGGGGAETPAALISAAHTTALANNGPRDAQGRPTAAGMTAEQRANYVRDIVGSLNSRSGFMGANGASVRRHIIDMVGPQAIQDFIDQAAAPVSMNPFARNPHREVLRGLGPQ